MGQLHSRTPSQLTPSDNHERPTHLEPSPTSRKATPRNHPRSLLRRSLPNFGSRSSSNSSSITANDTSESASHSHRKRWRASKRWSKATSRLENLAERSQTSIGPVNSDVIVDEPTVDEVTTDSRAAPPANEDPLVQGDPSSSRESPVFGDSAPSLLPMLSQAEDQQIQGEVAEFLTGGNANENGFALQEHPTLSSSNNVPTASDIEQPLTQTTPQQPLHFASPGTLVVVQGVVNTTDALLPQQSPSTSIPVTSAGSPLSSSVPQSASPQPREQMERRRRHRHSDIPVQLSGSPLHAEASSSLQDLHSNSHGVDHSLDSGDVTSERSRAQVSERPSVPGDHGHLRPLSPGSIDVLGTLLSVAAAATAASLFSPNSVPAISTPHELSSPQLGATRPLSPTPTAGLGNFAGMSGMGFAPGAPIPVPNGRDGRMRNVWGSLRERLGIRNRLPSMSDTSAPSALSDPSAPGDPESTMRPGELMLAQMARALNVGLGLNPSGGLGESAQSTQADPGGAGGLPAVEQPPHREPPEDSFERFLVNLQADLRVVLAENGTQRSTGLSANGDASTAAAMIPSSSDDRASVASDVMPVRSDAGETRPDNDPIGDAATTDVDDIPPRSTTPTQPPPQTVDVAGTTPNTRGNPHGVNLWRLYRFQPIPAQQMQRSGIDGPPNTASLLRNNPPTDDVVTAPDASDSAYPPASDSAYPPASTSAHAPETTATVVVPVIVVGLQSVDMGDAEMLPSPLHERAEPSGQTPEDAGAGEVPEGVDTAAARGRTWQSRAANALRTFRPGRRSMSRDHRREDAGASRTFLIYVIGGYYPPDHHMVTGSDNLDSYEALWELAELLGQVKPPVASKEDIDKSGLQVIETADLKQCEADGRISSNCVDRCLICLDDYEADDEVRLLSCKHGFHKQCVDKWLQVGRNNCPACRTKGVSTTGGREGPITAES